MQTINTVLSVIQVVLAVAIIALVLLQQSKHQGLSGAISGGADTFFGKNKSSSVDSILNKLTIVGTVLMVVVTLLLNIIK